MEKMPVKQNHMYTVTCDGECNIYDHDTQALVHTHKEGEVQSQFTAIGMSVDYDNADAKLTLVFNSAPGGSSNGGNIESDLNVGHAAADAVAAVCTLTLGDLAQGGTLTDSNGQSAELANPHKYAEGWVAMPDATAAGTIAFGEHEAIEFEEKKGTKASGTFYISSPEETISVYNGDNEYSVALPEHYDSSVEEWNAAFTAAGCGLVCTSLESHGEVEVSVEAETAGEAGNGISIEVHGDVPVTLEGGQDARTPQEVVDALNASEDCPAVAALSHVDAQDAKAVFTALGSYESSLTYDFAILENGEEVNLWTWQAQDGDTVQELLAALNDDSGAIWQNTRDIEATLEDGKVVLRRLGVHGDASNGYVVEPFTNTPFAESEETPIEGGRDESYTITVTAKEYGVNDTIAISGSLFENQQGMSGGHGDYTIAELLEAIGDEFTDITAAEGSTQGTITLTANTAGKAANAITYTATGCFGSGVTRQGSTTRGKDAVQQTEYKIFLNGEEFTGGGGQPIAPVPEPLGTTTTLLHGHVYTLAVAGDTDLSALSVELYATAELWIDYTAGSVDVSGWSWQEDAPDNWEAGKRYCVVLRNDGDTIATINYVKDTPEQS